MIPVKQIIVLAILSLIIIAATNAPGKYKNLKILPQDISEQKLDSIMDAYSTALGVKCDFCHQPVAGFADSLDYASDLPPMKENARQMMLMTIHINKTYFNFDSLQRPEYLNVVHCRTCHRGVAYPADY